MKKILITSLLMLGVGASAQIRNNYTPTNGSITSTTAFIDASSSIVWNGSTNKGKGLVFPKTDLTTLTSISAPVSGLPTAFPNRMDGMLVYNTATGTPGLGATKTPNVTPGFYYYENKTTNLQGGHWVRLGGGDTTDTKKFWSLDGNGDATTANQAVIADIAAGNYTITGGNFIGTTTAGADLVTLGTKSIARLQIGEKTAQDVGGKNFDFVLDVFGKARFRKGIVTEKSTYPDYVFEQYFTGSSKINPNYVFKSLAETERFIKENNHLPGVTKITEFSKDGNKYLIDAADLATQNLEKVEELYLHTIEQQKEIETLKAEIAELKALIKK